MYTLTDFIALFDASIESDIIHLNVCGTRIIVLNSLKVVVDLFDKRSAIYSSR